MAELLMAKPGISVRAIAKEIGHSAATVHRDVQAIRAEWVQRRSELYESKAAEDLTRTDAAIAALWPQIQKGNQGAIDRLVSLLTYRSKVLGLETQKAELDIGEVLASYLSRVEKSNDAPAP